MVQIKAAALSVTGLLATVGGVYESVAWFDGRYAPRAQVEDMFWENLKRGIRDIRRDIRLDPDNPNLQEDLEDYLDKLCHNFPDDRECDHLPHEIGE